jgi:ABC-type transport system substrate-binding protein
LTLTLQLRRQAKFHDGTPVTASAVVPILRDALPKAMGSAFEDIGEILAIDDTHIRFLLRRPAPLVIEALETVIQKPGKNSVSVGPYVPTASASPLELKANTDYYLGRPATPWNRRAAWRYSRTPVTIST